MLTRTCLLALVLAIAARVALTPAEARADELDGVVRLFVEKPGKSEAEPEAEVQVKLKTKRRRGTRAVLKVEGRYYDRDLYIKDAYLDHAVNRAHHLRLGIDKKTLGLEYQESSDERLTLHRSHVYQRLETLGLAGRQLEFRWLTRPRDSDAGMYADLGVGMDGSRNQNALASLRYRLGPFGWGAWGLIERHRIEHTYLPVWAAVCSWWVDTGAIRVATELFGGTDALATEFERTHGDGHTVAFYGPRAEVALRIPLTEHWSLEPFVQGSLLARDAREPSAGHQAQGLAGLNLRSKRLVFRTNAELVSERGSTAEDGSAGDQAPESLQRRATYHASAALSF
ncbi:MAG TPA: hypothetical protein VFU02_20870 [Polyangiaceae bacterium]|nr:hypothetical protein [Polyangiaceae bacterium]